MHTVIHPLQQRHYKEYGESTDHSCFVETDTQCKTYTGSGPQTGCGGKAFDLVATGDDNGAGT